jgi:hypothetical protein
MTSFNAVPVATANTSPPPNVILSGLPNGPRFAIASVVVSNGSGQGVTLICAVGEFGGAYSFEVPGNSGGPGAYVTTVSFTGGSNSSSVQFGCHIWGDSETPIEDVTMSGTIEASAFSSLTVQE